MALNNYFNTPVDFYDRPKAKLWICKPNFSRIERLHDITNLNGNFKFNNINSISFQISPLVFDEVSKEEVKNPLFDIIKNKYVIEYHYNGFKDYLTIEDIKKVSDDSDKILVNAESIATELNKKTANEVKMLGSTLNQIIAPALAAYAPLWKIGFIDHRVEEMKREVDIQNGTIMSLIDYVNEQFGTVAIFNNKLRQVSFVDAEHAGTNRGLRVRENSYLKSFEDSLVSKDVITRLYPFGKDGLTINSINPAGTDYIEDFSYFIKPFRRDEDRNVLEHSDYMTDELCHAILDHTAYFNSQRDTAELISKRYADLLKDWSAQDLKLREISAVVQRQEDRIEILRPKSEYIDLGTIGSDFNLTLEKSSYYLLMIRNDGNLTNIKSNDAKIEYNLEANKWLYIRIDAADFQDATKVKEKLLMPFTVKGSTVKLRTVLTRSSKEDYEEEDLKKIEEKYNYIHYSSLKDEQTRIVKAIEAQLGSLEDSRAALIERMNPKKFMSEELYAERELYVLSAIWSEENHTEAKELFEDAAKQLGKQNNLTRSVSVNIVNFIQSLEDKENWDKLNVGDIIVFSNKIFDEKLRAYITDININFETNDITLTISDVFDYKDLNQRLSDKLATVSSTATQVGFHKSQLLSQSGKLTKMRELIEAEWDANKKRILAGNETVDIGSHGVKVISNDNPNEYVVMVGGVIAMTKDGGETFKTGITPEGINAEMLLGKVILGENLMLQNQSGDMRFTDEGLEINASKFKLSTDTGKDFFDEFMDKIKGDAAERERLIRDEFKLELSEKIMEADDVINIVNQTHDVIKDAFADGIITEVEKKMIEDSLNVLDKENNDYLREIDQALEHPYILDDDIALLSDARTRYVGLYVTLVESINLAIADMLATPEETNTVTENIKNFRDEVSKILALVQDVLLRTQNNQIELKIEEGIDFLVRMTDDMQDEMDDFQRALGDVNKTIEVAVADSIIEASERESIKTALEILKAEFMDIENRYEVIEYNKLLDDADKQLVTDKFLIYKREMTEFEQNVMDMIADDKATDEEKEKYKIAFDELTLSRADYSAAYTEALIKISSLYTDDLVGRLSKEFDGLRDEVLADLEDMQGTIDGVEAAIGETFGDGIITEGEMTRLRVHLDMLEREYQDVETNYSSVNNSPYLSASVRSTLGTARSQYATAHADLKKAINDAIADKKVDSAEKTNVDSKLITYRQRLSAYTTRIQEALQDISNTMLQRAEDAMREKHTKVVSTIETLVDGLEIQSEAGNNKSIARVDPNKITLNSKKIVFGDNGSNDIIIQNGKTSIKYAVIEDSHINMLTFDKVQGGNLILGGTISVPDNSVAPVYRQLEDGTYGYEPVYKDKTFEDATFEIYDNDGNAMVSISKENTFFQNLTAGTISAERVEEGSAIASVSTSDQSFWIARYLSESDYDNPEFDGSSEDKPIHFDKLHDILPDIINHEYTLTISKYYPSQDKAMEYFELVGIQGGGKVVIDTNGQSCYFNFEFVNCTPDIVLTNNQKQVGTLYFDMDSTTSDYHILNSGSKLVTIENLKLQTMNGGGGVSIGIRGVYSGFTDVRDCLLTGHNDGIRSEYGHYIYTKNNDGQSYRFGTSAFYLGTAAVDTQGVSSYAVGNSYYESNTGTLKLTNSAKFPRTPTATSENKTPPAPKPVNESYKTTTWKATTGNNFYGTYWITSGDWLGRVVSGRWTGFPSQSGIWIFPSTMRSTLKGKTISKITITLTRHTKYGYAKAIPVFLRMHNYTSLPSGSTSPSMSSGYKSISLKQGETKTFDITSTFKTLMSSGNYAGFGLRSPYDVGHYASLSKSAKVTVTYKS